jgi:hypothetical protein
MLLQRNPGLFFLPGMLIVLWILLTKEKGGLKKYLILFGVMLSGSLIWNINVLFLEGNQNIFKELFEGVNVVQNLIDITNEVGRSFIYGGWQVLATSVGIVIIMWALYYLIKLNYDKSSILIILFLSYLIFWVFIGIPEDNISRFLAPVTPIIIVLFVSFMQFINNRIAMFRRNKIPISIIFIGALCYSVLRLFNNMTYWIE